jgi:hypothetical protein
MMLGNRPFGHTSRANISKLHEIKKECRQIQKNPFDKGVKQSIYVFKWQ